MDNYNTQVFETEGRLYLHFDNGNGNSYDKLLFDFNLQEVTEEYKKYVISSASELMKNVEGFFSKIEDYYSDASNFIDNVIDYGDRSLTLYSVLKNIASGPIKVIGNTFAWILPSIKSLVDNKSGFVAKALSTPINGAGSDEIYGEAGDDTLYGYSEDGSDDGSIDILIGGAGNDALYGGDNKNQSVTEKLYGGSGDDTLVGGAGFDYLDGGKI